MTEFADLIAGSDHLIDWFGYWPSFHDAEIHWIKLERSQFVQAGSISMELLIDTFEITSHTKPNGFLKLAKRSLVHLRFEGCAGINLQGFNQQNQLSCIKFTVEWQRVPEDKTWPIDAVHFIENGQTQAADRFLRVSLFTEFGLDGEFKCHRGYVVSITPWEPPKLWSAGPSLTPPPRRRAGGGGNTLKF